jgi:ATP-dependent helicase/nuclease subunit B
MLEDDALMTPSVLMDEVERAGLAIVERAPDLARVLEIEALGLTPIAAGALPQDVARTAAWRVAAAPARRSTRFRGTTEGCAPPAFSVSALERYQDCPFRYFARDVLRIDEPPDDDAGLSPRARGRLIHEVFQRFFDAWDRQHGNTITTAGLDEARALFDQVAEPMLAALPAADAALERTRLFGSAVAMGLVDVVLGLEAARPVRVVERWLEHRFDGAFRLGTSSGTPVPLAGVADRIDLLEGRRLRVIDYKSGAAPKATRALQVPVYALCAVDTLEQRGGAPWTVDEAAYVAFTGRRTLVPVIRPGGAPDVLASARERVLHAVDGVSSGAFPPRPHDPLICRSCAYPSVCRKDYVVDA